MNKITIYTDGSSRGNPGPGGWGSIVINGSNVHEIGGRSDMTTNNKMELTAAIEGLKAVDSTSSITVYSDSEYVIKGITEWIFGWQKRGWRNAQKKPVLNRELWEELLEATKGKKITWTYVRGHSENEGNNRCDIIATQFADNEKMDLYKGTREKYPVKISF